MENCTLEGSLSVEGSNPFDRSVIIADCEGVEWILVNPGLEGELARLEGLSVKVDYPVSGMNNIEHILKIESYEIIPPEGMAAIAGVLDNIEDHLAVIMKSGKRYRIYGDLVTALSNYSGYRVWVWGDLNAALSASDPDSMDVKGYEVMSKFR